MTIMPTVRYQWGTLSSCCKLAKLLRKSPSIPEVLRTTDNQHWHSSAESAKHIHVFNVFAITTFPSAPAELPVARAPGPKRLQRPTSLERLLCSPDPSHGVSGAVPEATKKAPDANLGGRTGSGFVLYKIICDFPGSPVYKTLHFRCKGAWVQFPVREQISHLPRRVAKNFKT